MRCEITASVGLSIGVRAGAHRPNPEYPALLSGSRPGRVLGEGGDKWTSRAVAVRSSPARSRSIAAAAFPMLPSHHPIGEDRLPALPASARQHVPGAAVHRGQSRGGRCQRHRERVRQPRRHCPLTARAFNCAPILRRVCHLLCSLRRRALAHRCCKRTFPWTQWLPLYNFKTDLVRDVVAGVTVGVMAVPQAMSYATVAGESLRPCAGADRVPARRAIPPARRRARLRSAQLLTHRAVL